jgi:hypothetical protein
VAVSAGVPIFHRSFDGDIYAWIVREIRAAVPPLHVHACPQARGTALAAGGAG